MTMLETDRIALHVDEGGEGEPVLFISGSGGDLRSRPNVLDGPLARSRRVIAYDQRGLGLSDKPSGPYSMADYGDDAASLLDALEIDRVDVVGVSFGGMVAQHLVLDHPERVNRLVLCCTSPGGSMPSYPFHEMSADLDAVERMLHLMPVSDTRRDTAWQAANPDIVDKSIEQARAAAIADHETPDFRRGYRLQLEARAGHDTLDRLGGIESPTMICAGRYDGIAPPQNQECLQSAIPGASLHWYEGGHLFLIQDRAAWRDIIEFLG